MLTTRFSWAAIAVVFAARCFAQAPVDLNGPAMLLNESFEGEIPALHLFQANYEVTKDQANTGFSSLLVTPTAGKSGGAYFRLGDKLAPGKSYEFTTFVKVTEGGRVSFYISGANGKTRRTMATTSGGESGKWVKLKGLLSPADWMGGEQDLMLALISNTPTYFDDVRLQEIETKEPPIASWPKSLRQLKGTADGLAQQLKVGRTLTLQAKQGALSSDLSRAIALAPSSQSVEIAQDGALVFAIDLPEAAVISGSIRLRHTGDLRPGLRAYVLFDSILSAAPMVSAAPWSNPGGVINRPAPSISGRPPDDGIDLTPCTLKAGRHYLIIAGPHTRPAGKFLELTLKAAKAKDSPLYSFAFLTDAHLGEGRTEWMNMKLTGPAEQQLKQTLGELKAEGLDMVFLGGDMTDAGTTSQYANLHQLILESGMTVYGVMGNHETFQPTSRTDRAKLLKDIFPGNTTYYTLMKPPLRFVILDKSFWRNAAGAIKDYPSAEFTANTINPEQVNWLRTVFFSNPNTPTLILCHFPIFASPGVSSSGYEVVSWALSDKSTELISESKNVLAVLNGHTHWNQVGKAKRISWIQNAAFVEWPAMYRVFRVYSNRIEWETRLVSNLGFVRETLIPEKHLTWMISTGPEDLAGTIRLH